MRRRPSRAFWPALFLLVALATSSSFATQVIPQSPEEMGSFSDLVVRGRVESVRSFWNESHTRILTEVVVGVDRQLKGRATDRVRVVQMGGVVGDMRMTVSGALAWRPNEDVLLFLERGLPGRFRVAGFSQGKFTIERDPSSGVEFARQAGLAGVELVGGGPPALGTARRLRLETLLERIGPAIEEGR